MFPSLFLHPITGSVDKDESRRAISYLPDPAPNNDFSPSTIGTILVKEGEQADDALRKPNRFDDNPDFVTLLHSVLSEAVWTDPALQTEAKARHEGYIHLADRRAPPGTASPCLKLSTNSSSQQEVNRVPDPSNLLGSMLVQDGKLIPGTSVYSPCTLLGAIPLMRASRLQVRAEQNVQDIQRRRLPLATRQAHECARRRMSPDTESRARHLEAKVQSPRLHFSFHFAD